MSTLHLLMWEGWNATEAQVEAILSLRAAHPDLVFIHAISSSLFLRGDVLKKSNLALITKAFKPGDGIIAHISGWKSVISQTNIPFRQSPTFWGETLLASDCDTDCGGDIPITAYGEGEIERIIAISLKTLANTLQIKPKGLHVAGWQASPRILEVAARAGLKYDFSSVPPELIQGKTKYFPIFKLVSALWKHISPHTQPFDLNTASGKITSYPLSLASFDYVNRDLTLQIMQEFSGQEQSSIYPLVLHVESAQTYAPVMTSTLTALKGLAKEKGFILDQHILPELTVTSDEIVQKAVAH